MTNDYRSTLASVCEHKRSYEPIVVNASRNTFSPNNELKITQTAITGDVFTNFNTSYIELELETELKSTVVSYVYQTEVSGQPSCLVSRITGDYKYIDPFTGEEVACDLSNDELHIGLYRTIVNMVYMPKSVHEQNSYLTEYPFYGVNNYINERNDNFDYEITYKHCFENRIPFFKSGSKYIAKVRIPWNSLLDIGAQPYLVNVKSMNLTISWVDQKDFFTDKENLTNPVYIKSARTVTDYYRVNSLKSLPWGEEALVRPNIFPIGQNYELLKEQTRWHQSFRIPYAPKACFLFFTDTSNNLVSLKPLNIDYFRCYTGSGFSNHLPQYQNIYTEASTDEGKLKYLPDSRFFDELMYVANPAEKHMIDYNTFTKFFRIYAIDFESSAELLASQNEIYFELRFDKTRDKDLNVHVVFIENAPDYNISVEPIA